MLAPLLAVLSSLIPVTGSPSPAAVAQQPAPQDAAAQAIKDAGKDVPKLLKLAQEWSDKQNVDAARMAWKRVLELAADNAAAHTGLGHQLYDGKWFETHTELFDYQRTEAEQMAKKGLARLGDKWVPIADVSFLKLGFERDGNSWISPLTKARLQREQDLLKKGWQQQDLTWVDPEEFEEWKKGLWKCGDKWLDNAAADQWHADLAHPWLVAGEHFVVSATVERERVEWCKWHADQTWDDLVRIFGVEPGARVSAVDLFGDKRNKPQVIVLRSLPQFNAFAAGDEVKKLPLAETDGFSSLHYAFFADALIDASVKPAAFAGAGVALWDNSSPTMEAYGKHAIRHAAAQSFVEAIDPSWKTLAESAGGQARSTVPFWAEKKIPRWLRYGAASYVERYFVDKSVGEGGDSKWARTWALASLKKGGGLRDLQKVFEFKLTLADVPGSTQLIHEAGLVVAFVLDGGDKQVQAALQALQAALRAGGATDKAAAELQKALLAAKPAIAKFAGA
jgi:hypothetical protein